MAAMKTETTWFPSRASIENGAGQDGRAERRKTPYMVVLPNRCTTMRASARETDVLGAECLLAY